MELDRMSEELDHIVESAKNATIEEQEVLTLSNLSSLGENGFNVFLVFKLVSTSFTKLLTKVEFVKFHQMNFKGIVCGLEKLQLNRQLYFFHNRNKTLMMTFGEKYVCFET